MNEDGKVLIQPDAIYDLDQVAQALGVCTKTVRHWIAAQTFPRPFKQGRRYYWRGVTLISHFDGSRAVR